jgi:hypothetical protein
MRRPFQIGTRCCEINKKREISCRFYLPGKVDQSFDSSEYRFVVLDKDGVQVDEALALGEAALHRIYLPKAERSVVDESEFAFRTPEPHPRCISNP